MSDDWADYESGPFCRHWSDPTDCEIVCARCGHRCVNHPLDLDLGCHECDCPGWGEAEDFEYGSTVPSLDE